MKTDTQGLIDHYLKELERELSALPRSRRREVMDDVRAHISEARAEGGDDELAIREVLDRLGDPSEIAADARERFGVHPARVGFMEVMALILLPIGGVVLPVIGWIAGVILLWVSPAWITRDKVIGTLVVPGGLRLPFTCYLCPPTREHARRSRHPRPRHRGILYGRRTERSRAAWTLAPVGVPRHRAHRKRDLPRCQVETTARPALVAIQWNPTGGA